MILHTLIDCASDDIIDSVLIEVGRLLSERQIAEWHETEDYPPSSPVGPQSARVLKSILSSSVSKSNLRPGAEDEVQEP